MHYTKNILFALDAVRFGWVREALSYVGIDLGIPDYKVNQTDLDQFVLDMKRIASDLKAMGL